MICIEAMLGRCIHADNGGWGSVRQPASHSRLGGPSARRQSHRRWPSPVIVAATQVLVGASFEERPGFGVSGASSQQSHQPVSVHSAQGTCTAVHSRVRRQTFASAEDGQSLSHVTHHVHIVPSAHAVVHCGPSSNHAHVAIHVQSNNKRFGLQ